MTENYIEVDKPTVVKDDMLFLNGFDNYSNQIIVKQERTRPLDHKWVEELARSIEQTGMLQPITVSKDFNGNYTIVSGLHRYKAIELLHKRGVERTLWCKVTLVEGLATKLIEMDENLVRNDLSSSERKKLATEREKTLNIYVKERYGSGNPELGNPELGNPELGNPELGNPELGNPELGNPELGNPELGNPEPGNPEPGFPPKGWFKGFCERSNVSDQTGRDWWNEYTKSEGLNISPGRATMEQYHAFLDFNLKQVSDKEYDTLINEWNKNKQICLLTAERLKDKGHIEIVNLFIDELIQKFR